MNEPDRRYSVWTTENDATRYMPGTVPPDVRVTDPMSAPDAFRLRRQLSSLFPEVPWTLRHESDSRTDVPLDQFHDCDTDHPGDHPGETHSPPLRCRFYGMHKAEAAVVTISFTCTTHNAAAALRILATTADDVEYTEVTTTDATGLRVPHLCY